jgi:hypothetical protein
MKRILQSLFRKLKPSNKPTARRARARLECEALEERQLLSSSPALSAITTNHSYYNPYSHSLYRWTDHDLFAIDANTQTVVDYKNGTRIDLSQNGPQGVLAVSAGVDANGWAEVFAIDSMNSGRRLWRYDGGWQLLSTAPYSEISATRDGQVYAGHNSSIWTGTINDVQLFDANGVAHDLGNPGSYASSITAGVDRYGRDQVFAINGRIGAIYVNDANSGWSLVDNSQLFLWLSATQNNVVFATTSSGALYMETMQTYYYGSYAYSFWAGQQLGAGQTFGYISADTDASGNAEVYAIDSGHNAYRFSSSGSPSLVDTNVSNIAGADAGYFFDVNPTSTGDTVWARDPSAGWQYLGSNVDKG